MKHPTKVSFKDVFTLVIWRVALIGGAETKRNVLILLYFPVAHRETHKSLTSPITCTLLS